MRAVKTRPLDRIKDTMRTRFPLVAMIALSILAATLVLLAACSGTSSSATQISTLSDIQETPATRVDAQIDAGTPISVATEPTVSQMPPIHDGPALLERHCAKCHLVQSLQQIKKARAEWERTLAQMEGMGVHLDDTEKINLLDYLSEADKP